MKLAFKESGEKGFITVVKNFGAAGIWGAPPSPHSAGWGGGAGTRSPLSHRGARPRGFRPVRGASRPRTGPSGVRSESKRLGRARSPRSPLSLIVLAGPAATLLCEGKLAGNFQTRRDDVAVVAAGHHGSCSPRGGGDGGRPPLLRAVLGGPVSPPGSPVGSGEIKGDGAAFSPQCLAFPAGSS